MVPSVAKILMAGCGSPATLFSVPATVGGYELLQRLAVGGMAEVFLARRPGPDGFESAVALKRILRIWPTARLRRRRALVGGEEDLGHPPTASR